MADKENIIKLNTGSHKDLRLGKGRYDLIPLDVLGELIRGQLTKWDGDSPVKELLNYIHKARVATKGYEGEDTIEDIILVKADWLHQAIYSFVTTELKGNWIDLTKRLALLFEKGAAKYSERDWEKGRPMSIFINSALRHLFQYYNSETDEDHAAAFVWNLLACIDTINKMPEMANK